MNLKKIIQLLLIAMSFAVVAPALASNEMPVTKKTENPADLSSQELLSRSKELSNRRIEIREMDKSNLSKEEKTALKEEARAIKKEERAMKKEERRRGLIFGIGILGVVVIVLLLIWIF